MRVAFRADASITLGNGHVMRSLTLANELKKRNCSPFFLCRNLAGNLISKIRKNGFPVYTLRKPIKGAEQVWSQPGYKENLDVFWQEDSKEVIQALSDRSHLDLLVVDHYALDHRWHRKLRTTANKIMVIDDLANRRYDCDILLDQTFRRVQSDYIHLVPEHCLFLLGTKVTLLRPQFARLRKAALDKRNTFSDRKTTILLSMGGTDPDNLTGIALRALCRSTLLGGIAKVLIVLGCHAPHAETIRMQARNTAFATEVLQDVDNMAEIMYQADLAIGTGGTTSWERCALALPSILIVDADNQVMIARELSTAQAVISLFPSKSLEEEIASSVYAILHDPNLYKQMAINASLICDGRGVCKVADELIDYV